MVDMSWLPAGVQKAQQAQMASYASKPLMPKPITPAVKPLGSDVNNINGPRPVTMGAPQTFPNTGSYPLPSMPPGYTPTQPKIGDHGIEGETWDGTKWTGGFMGNLGKAGGAPGGPMLGNLLKGATPAAPAASPTAWNQDYATQWGTANNFLKSGETATGGLLQDRVNAAGQGDALSAARAAAGANPNASAPGVKPLTVAGMNTYQQGAISDMGKPSAPIDPRAGASFDKASAATDAAGTPYDYTGYQKFLNPFMDEVINRNANDITRSYDVNRNAANESSAAAGGFGSTAQGVERGAIDEAQGRQIGDMSAQLRAQGYDTATTNSLGLYNNDRTANLARASQYGNIGDSFQNLDQYGRNITTGDQSRKLYAGDRIQTQNQAELDAWQQERDRQLNYPYQQTDFLKGVLGAYPTGNTQTSTQPGVGMAQGAAGGGLLGWKLGDLYKGGASPLQMSAAANGFSAF